MLNWTDKNYRFFMRQINKKVVLFTEMVVANAIIYNHKKLLEFNQCEQPLVLQLGGSDPKNLHNAVKIAIDYGYNAFNLNVGCPSERVQSGKFGACLMREPNLVAECIDSMIMAANSPNNVSIKHRIGLNYDYSYNALKEFVAIIASVGCNKFIVHARHAILEGLNPKENRTIPPLKYDIVYQLKQDFPDLYIELNGGITALKQAQLHQQYVDGVMIGRAAYHNPFIFADGNITRKQVLENMLEYCSHLLNNDNKMHNVTRHMLGLYYNTSLAKTWRRNITHVASNNSLQSYKELVCSLPDNL
jgi:tRNA-dihydrouridine synthase A